MRFDQYNNHVSNYSIPQEVQRKLAVTTLQKDEKFKARVYVGKTASYFSSVLGVPVDKMLDFDASYRSGGPCELTYYYNGLGEDVEVINRCGLPQMIRTCGPVEFKGRFVIRKVIILADQISVRNAYKYVMGLGKNIDSVELMKIYENMRNLNGSESQFRLAVDYYFDQEEIREMGSFYDPTTDLVISLSSCIHKAEHPFSSQSGRQSIVGDDPQINNPYDVIAMIRYINNDPDAGALYTKLFGKVITLRPQKGPGCKQKVVGDKLIHLTEYVEVYSSKNADKKGSELDLSLGHPQLLQVSEAKLTFGLFDSYSQALENGDFDKVHEAKRKEDERLAKQADHEAKLERDRFDAEHKRRLADEEAQHRRMRELEDQERRFKIEQEASEIRKQHEIDEANLKRQRAEEDAEHKRRLAEMSHTQAQAIEKERAEKIMKLDEQKAELERKIKEMAQRQEREHAEAVAAQKLKEAQAKHTYEEKGYAMKNSSEAFKIAGAAFMSGLAIAIAIIKLIPASNSK